VSGNVTELRPMRATDADAVYLSPAQVCELVPGLTVANLKDLRASGKGPAYRKPTGERGHVTVYRRSDVIAWVERARVATTDQPAVSS
jgi:hypothetical protein